MQAEEVQGVKKSDREPQWLDDEIELLLNVTVDWESVRSKYKDILSRDNYNFFSVPDKVSDQAGSWSDMV